MERCDVIALIVHAAEDPSRVLLGVRAPVPTSPRHPEVLSTPTMRVPAAVMEATLAEELAGGPPALEPGEIRPLRGARSANFGRARSGMEPVAFLAEHLLSRKLGVSAELAQGKVAGIASAAVLAMDEVLDPASTDGGAELTHMLTIRLALETGADAFPEATEHYSRLHWVEAAKLPAAVAANRPISLVPDIDLNVCLHGLCVRSAAAHFAEEIPG